MSASVADGPVGKWAKARSGLSTCPQAAARIDVCEAWLDIHIAPAGECFRVANSRAGHRRLKRRLAGYDVGLIVIEPRANGIARSTALCMHPATGWR